MTSKLLAVLLIILLCAPDFAVAQTLRPLKPSPDLFAADIDKLIADLKAGKANASQIASAEALSNFSKVNGLMGALSPTVESFIEASANHDYAAGRDFLAKMGPFELGEAAYVLHSYGVAQKYWLPLAQSGDVAAQLNVALMYSNGTNGAVRSEQESFKWYHLAATQRSEVGQENLAVLYAEGAGVPQDNLRAFVWFSLAAQQAVKDGHTATSISLIKRRDVVAQQLAPEAQDHALQLIQKCAASEYKDCE